MDILTTDISTLSFKAVKEMVDKIKVNEIYKSKELIYIINVLKNDKRKNINSLGDKLKKSKEKIENEKNRAEKNLKVFKNRLRTIVEQQLDVVEEIEQLEIE